MKKFVIGDIHGAAKALTQCLQRSSFDYQHDMLICLGDVCDGWPESKQAMDELLKIDNLVFVMGNHDQWALDWALTGTADGTWLKQGGESTIKSYADGIPETHISLWQRAVNYYLDENRLFVHAGIEPEAPLEAQGPNTFLWDRNLYRTAMARRLNGNQANITVHDEVYIGHTPIHKYSLEPIHSCEIWMMDTGAGWEGVLTIMDIESKECFKSDVVESMYPIGSGRVK